MTGKRTPQAHEIRIEYEGTNVHDDKPVARADYGDDIAMTYTLTNITKNKLAQNIDVRLSLDRSVYTVAEIPKSLLPGQKGKIVIRFDSRKLYDLPVVTDAHPDATAVSTPFNVHLKYTMVRSFA